MIIDEKLARLKNHNTRYEIVLTNGTDTKYLVLYTARHSQSGLRAAIRQRYDAILVLTGGEAPFAVKRSDIFKGREWRCFFSGRTQREAIIEGELPFGLADGVAQKSSHTQ
jgi:hypothetical protein